MISFIIQFAFRNSARTASVYKSIQPEKFTVLFSDADIIEDFGGNLELYRDEGRLMLFEMPKGPEARFLVDVVARAINNSDPSQITIDF